MDTNPNVEHLSDEHAVVGDRRIDVSNRSHLGRRKVEINWPSIGSVDLATAKRFAADLQTAIEIAERYAERNARQALSNRIARESKN